MRSFAKPCWRCYFIVLLLAIDIMQARGEYEGLTHGQFVPISNPCVRAFSPDPSLDQLRLPRRAPEPVVDAHYQDPVGHPFAGRWLAAFAPVGNTHLVVIVQTRFEDAVALDRLAARRLAWLAALAMGVVLAMIALALWTNTHRRLPAKSATR